MPTSFSAPVSTGRTVPPDAAASSADSAGSSDEGAHTSNSA